MCEVSVTAGKRFTVQQHIGRDKRVRSVDNTSKKKSSQLLLAQSASTSKSKSSEFYKGLSEVLVSENIPLWKLINVKLRDFLERHTGHSIPDESTRRKNYIQQCYDDTIRRIRERVRRKIFVSIDETSDVEGRYIANVIVRAMVMDGPGEIFLLTTESLDSMNHSTICRLFDRSMFLLWPEGVRHDDVLLSDRRGAVHSYGS
jgi:GTPase SAR1 family protein